MTYAQYTLSRQIQKTGAGFNCGAATLTINPVSRVCYCTKMESVYIYTDCEIPIFILMRLLLEFRHVCSDGKDGLRECCLTSSLYGFISITQ